MIDSPSQAMRLLSRLDAALPILARLTRELAAVVKKQSPELEVPEQARVTRVDYAGNEGGIICTLDLGGQEQSRLAASITHLKFDPRHALAREIAVYQRHRIKRIRREARLEVEPEQALALLRNAGSASRLRRRVPAAPATGLTAAKAAS